MEKIADDIHTYEGFEDALVAAVLRHYDDIRRYMMFRAILLPDTDDVSVQEEYVRGQLDELSEYIGRLDEFDDIRREVEAAVGYQR